MSSFENLRVVDNFYQTSLFFPMPTVVISTLCEDGSTTLGPYSLVQPYYVAGKDFYAMLLSCRNSSNTAQNILRTGKCAINFVDDKPKTFKECVKLSWPGDKPEDKMPNCQFKLEKSLMEAETGEKRPMVLTDSIQVIECTWVSTLDNAQDDKPGELNGYEPPYHDFNGITSKFGAHFILKVDRILIAFKSIGNEIKRRIHPNAVAQVRMDGHYLPDSTVSSVMMYIVTYIILVFISIVVVMLCGSGATEAVSGVIASIGSVGPGIGELGSLDNYSAEPILSKFVYAFDMFLGRVEIYPVLIVLSMMFNRGK